MSEKEMLIGTLVDSMIEFMMRKYGCKYIYALRVILSSQTYKDLYEQKWLQQQGPLYLQDRLEKEVMANKDLKAVVG